MLIQAKNEEIGRLIEDREMFKKLFLTSIGGIAAMLCLEGIIWIKNLFGF